MIDATPIGITPPSYRLPATTRPGRVRLQVADLDRSLAWYEGVLGLQARRDGDRALLSAHGSDAPLVELLERPGARPALPRGRPGLYHVALLLPDRSALGAFVRHLADAGARAGSADHLVSEALYLSDPDGLGVEVYADRPREAWRVQEREIAMATRSLDLEDLAQAATAPWRGAPAGTRVGHVHLHVGDLRAADAFYHGTLGLDRVVWSYPGALFLSAGGYHHHLGLNTWAGSAEPAGEEDARLLEWTLELPGADDVIAAAASFEAAGHPVERDGAGMRATDPWGTALRLTVASSERG